MKNDIRLVSARTAAIGYLNGQVDRFTWNGAHVTITEIKIEADMITFASDGVTFRLPPANKIEVSLTGEHPAPEPTSLTKDEMTRLGRIFGKTPSVLLPGSGLSQSRNVKTADDLLTVTEHIIAIGSAYVTESQLLRDQIAEEKRDLAAVGRVIARITKAAE